MINIIRKTTITSLLYLFSQSVLSQTVTLNEAMVYALDNSIDIAVQMYNNENLKYAKRSAVLTMLPSLSTSTALTTSYGRSIDPETNVYTTIGSLSNSYSLSSSVTVFSGLSKINTVKISKIKIAEGEQTLKQIEDLKLLEVMRLYFDALYYRQSIVLIKEQLELSRQQLELISKSEKLGIKSKADLAIADADYTSLEMMLTQNQGLYDKSILDLKIEMNYPLDSSIALVYEEVVRPYEKYVPADVRESVDVKLAQYNLETSRLTLKTYIGSYLPSLSIYSGLSSSYFTKLNSDYIVTGFSSQIKSNYGYYFGGSLSFTLFNGLYARNNVASSRNNLKIAELRLEQEENKALQYIEEALLQRKTSYDDYLASKKMIEANTLAYNAMKRKYEQGVASIMELQKASNEVLVSKSAKLKAALDYQIQSILVDYYSNKSIIDRDGY